MIELKSGTSSCRIDPDLGGSLLSFAVAGQPVLRAALPDTTDILETACFPLIPFANRIDRGRIRMVERIVTIPADPEGAPHALHGFGWRHRWSVAHRGTDDAILHLDSPDWWPWRCSATQHIRLAGDQLDLSIRVRNMGEEAMPIGLGFHPYFERAPDSHIAIDATSYVSTGADQLPDGERPFSGFDDGLTAFEGFDNFIPTDTQSCTVRTRGRTIEIRAIDPVAGFHVYVPESKDFFCVEPVTHRPNDFGLGDMRGALLDPGADRSLSVILKPV